MMSRKVTIQGVDGCFHEVAAKSYFAGEQIQTLSCMSFEELFERTTGDDKLYGVAAIENTIAGSLLQNYDMLRSSPLKIIGEHKLRISHSLVALPGQSIDSIEEVSSHPIALMQCREFLGRHSHMKVVERDDTAGSAQRIAHGGLRSQAAICSELAAEIYGLEVLERAIETNKRNFTRFLILASASQDDPAKVNKASLALCLTHAQGSLAKILAVLAFYDMNLTKIESMPIIGQEWEYRFYIDLTFEDYDRYRQSVEAVKPLTSELQILGEYAEAKEIV